jgi:type VI secretion system protein ImpF
MNADLPTLSLFDRLIDDAPDAQVEEVGDEEMQRHLKQGMRRDLEGLLNGKRPHAGWLSRNGALADTVVGFGLPDLSTDDFGSAAVRERIRRLISATIRAHEPRLRRVEVETDGGPTSAGVRFRISAVMLVEAAEEAVIYDASLRPTDREFAVRLSR